MDTLLLQRALALNSLQSFTTFKARLFVVTFRFRPFLLVYRK